MPEDRWAGIHYRSITATGQLWSLPARLYFIELAAHTHPNAAFIYDHTRFPQNLITVLAATAEAKSEPFPPHRGITLHIERGVYVSYSHVPVGMTGPVTIGFLLP